MVFVTLFTRLKNVHLIKDVGMIPYVLCRDHGFDCTMVTKKNDSSYDYADRQVKGLKLRFISGSGAYYLMRNAGRIDVLNVYHLNLQSFVNLLIFRIFRKKTAISYLKLDMDDKGCRRLFMKNPVGWIKRRTMGLADIASVETSGIYDILRKTYGTKILFLPDGYYTEAAEPEKDFHKEKYILTVGNLGTEAKATGVLTEAFEKAVKMSGCCDWKLELVGPVAAGYVNPYPYDDRIIFDGNITDRMKLNEIYRRASIFAFPSRHESFGIAMLEAAACGDYIVSTEGVPAAADIAAVTGAGETVGVDDADAMAEAFCRLMTSERDWNGLALQTAEKTFRHYRWERLVLRLVDYIR